MTLDSLLRPGGDPWKIIPYAFLVAFIGGSGQIVVALQFDESLWALCCALHAVYCPLFIIGAAHGLVALHGQRMPVPWAIAISVIVGCFAAQVVLIDVT